MAANLGCPTPTNLRDDMDDEYDEKPIVLVFKRHSSETKKLVSSSQKRERDQGQLVRQISDARACRVDTPCPKGSTSLAKQSPENSRPGTDDKVNQQKKLNAAAAVEEGKSSGGSEKPSRPRVSTPSTKGNSYKYQARKEGNDFRSVQNSNKPPEIEDSDDYGDSDENQPEIADSDDSDENEPEIEDSDDYDENEPEIEENEPEIENSDNENEPEIEDSDDLKSSSQQSSAKKPKLSSEGKKWTKLVHNGVIFPPLYKPHGIKMLYKGQPVDLTPEQEEVATMFAVLLDTDYMNKPRFKDNFFSDWKKILGKKHVIQKLEDCDFTPIYEWHQIEKEKKKQMTREEKKTLKEEKLKQEEKYMWAWVDGNKEKVGNFRVEPPGLFRGRGDHPKMGKLKKRILPSDITINIGKDSPIPEGERWKEIRHDNTVTWLAFWNDPINPKEYKYVFLASSSTLKGQSDKEKYEKARLLKDYIDGIRAAYTKDFKSKNPTKKQIAVATYLIDKLSLRAGNEKDDDEADTVGCCTLKVENVETVPPNILKFDFLGKDSIRYQNEVEVEAAVFKAIQQFRSGKKLDASEDLFDRLDTNKLNAHLKELMPGLTAKVFRTYNASITLDEMLSRETTKCGGDVAEKIMVYQYANKEVAIICNHQRTVSKSHSAQMSRLNDKIEQLRAALEELKSDLSRAKKGKPPKNNDDGKPKRNSNPEALEKKIAQTSAKIEKMERDKETKEDLKTVALGTSKINYLDPRITVAWCKRHEVPIEKMFNKSLLAKFTWAMDVDPRFRF